MEVVEWLMIINVYDQGKEALREYADKHKKDKSREMYVYNTKNAELLIEENKSDRVYKANID